MADELQKQLRDIGIKLKTPPISKEEFLKLLEGAADGLHEIKQSPVTSVQDSLKPFYKAISNQGLLEHQDSDIKVLIATCICEVFRINAPDTPFSDDVLKNIFGLIVETFNGLSDLHCSAFGRRVSILEKTARYRTFLVMLDLECDNLINEMFNTFFAVVSDDHPKSVFNLIQNIMVRTLDESDDIPEQLLSTVLLPLGRERTDFSLTARRLAMDVIEKCAEKLEPHIKKFLVFSLSERNRNSNNPNDSHEVIYDIYQCAPKILSGIVPDIKGQLLSDLLDVRLKAVQLLGELFSLPGISISESFQPVFSEFLNKSTDKAVEVRTAIVEHLMNFLISNPSRPEALSIIHVLCDLLLDDNENVRQQAITALHRGAYHSEDITVKTVRQVAERLQDKSPSIRSYTMEKLADLYRFYSSKGVTGVELNWVPGKILRCLYDTDARSEEIELVFCAFLFPPELSINNRLQRWAKVFSEFDKAEVKALEKILMQKQRLQQELQKYLSLRQSYQEDGSEYQKQVSVCFRTMSHCFSDPMKAEEGFQKLDQFKDANITKMLKSLLDPSASFTQMWSFRVEMLKIIGEQHTLYDFVSLLSTKCSYLLFNKEFLKEIFVEVSAPESPCNAKSVSTCMGLLEMIASHSPDLLSGFEENLVSMLKEDNDIVKEGVAHVLAIAGGNIREQLATTSSSIDLLLERLCLEGTRRQAKYSVQALTAITEDDGLKSLSVLYKKIVDMLEDRTHMPTLLQSLGCIAQFAMPIYETREEEIYEFIKHKILEVNNKIERSSTNDNESKDISELCMLKIFGIKTLVKSYLPVRDAHLRPGIGKIIEILKNILSFGNVSKDIKSSVSDKEHMKVASVKAILRLSRQWDHMIPLDVFYTILRVLEGIDDESRKTFILKVQRYIVEHLLDAKYACIFLLNIREYPSPEYEEGKHHLLKTIKNCQQPKMGHSLMQSDGDATFHYLEYILVYLVHALAHCPLFDQCNNVIQFEPIYWQLYLFLSVLLIEEGGPNLRENHTGIVSIFQSIKLSEDAFEKSKSKVSHVICDLGLLVAKRLVGNQSDISDMFNMLRLPHILYKPIETKENEITLANGEKPWFSAESILAHFESLNFKDKRPSISDAQKDDMNSHGSGTSINEVSIENMMKSVKSEGSVLKKSSEKKASPSYMEVPEKEADILRVKEINVDMNIDKNIESGELTRSRPILNDQLSNRNNGNEENLTSQIRKETNGIAFLPTPTTPKRKRSVSMQRSQSVVTEGQKERKLLAYSRSSKKNSSGKKISREQDSLSPVPDLVSHLPSIKRSSKNDNETPKKRKNIDDSKSPTSSSRKRKRSSTSSLARCSSNDSPSKYKEIIDSRIKVWWPLDKAYYEGVVQSYDTTKKKYKILYDDGDIELLNLDRERWELVTAEPRKQSKLQSSSSKSSDKEVTQKRRTLKKHKNSKVVIQSESGNEPGGGSENSSGDEPHREDKEDRSSLDSKNGSDIEKS